MFRQSSDDIYFGLPKIPFYLTEEQVKWDLQNPSTFFKCRSCGLMDKASDFYESSYPEIAGSSPATINSIWRNY